eukprot:TRINITY_DN3524_c0_g1_i1.p2 TRINITY_DN3524_c0_g1~~TRINITY_DN3524_c0_g1_i1.p2  ORF type:complete len:351 (+),score=46.78 TRINITY_DN3524_c0_g1_i1:20-1072(+)
MSSDVPLTSTASGVDTGSGPTTSSEVISGMADQGVAPGGRRNILLCVDGSEESASAVFALAYFLHPTDTITIFTSYSASSGIFTPHSVHESRLRAQQRTAEQLVEFARRVMSEHGRIHPAQISTHVEITSSVPKAITNFALARRFDIISLGSRGLSGLKRMLIGSVSQHVLTHAPTHSSVLVVQNSLKQSFGTAPAAICVLYDGDDNSETAARFAGTFARPQDTVTVLMAGVIPAQYSVVPSGMAAGAAVPNPSYAVDLSRFEGECEETVQEGRVLIAQGGRVPLHQISCAVEYTTQDVPGTLISHLRENGYDAVIIGPRDLSSLRRTVERGISLSILHANVVPIVVSAR